MVMERLGPSLFKIMQSKLARPRLASSGMFFSLEEVARIGAQMVSTLEFVHDRHFIHQNIRPEHIVYDLRHRRVVLIGYGTAQRYRDATTLRHFPELPGGAVGSPHFTSAGGHLGRTLSRRDDMESLGYVLVYLFRGTLPWVSTPCKTDVDLFVRKSSIRPEDLCGGLQPLCNYFQSVKLLSFDQTPEYDDLRRMMHALAQQ